MKLVDLVNQVNALNTKLVDNNSIYRLKVDNNGQVELLDKDGGPTHDPEDPDDRFLNTDDLPAYVDDLIGAEKSYL